MRMSPQRTTGAHARQVRGQATATRSPVAALGLALCLLVTGVTGCTGGAKGSDGTKGGAPSSAASPPPAPAAPPPVPPGWTRAQAKLNATSISVATPPGWREAASPKGWAMTMQWERDGKAIARLGVITEVPQADDAKVVAAGVFTGVQVGAKVERRTPNRPVRVPGAASALRVDYEYTDRANGNEARGGDVSIALGQRKAVAVRVVGIQDRLPLTTIDQILRTIAVQRG